jgi:hypothetical protein
MKAYGEVDIWIHIFLTSSLAGGEWLASGLDRFTPEERSPGSWVGPRVGLDDLEKRKFLTLPGLKLRPLGRPVRIQSLYRLRCPGSYIVSHRNTVLWQFVQRRREVKLSGEGRERTKGCEVWRTH